MKNIANLDPLSEEYIINVSACGNSAHVRVAKKWIGKRVKIKIEEVSE